jgi:Zn-dependent peptidase ImmA (M78 family)
MSESPTLREYEQDANTLALLALMPKELIETDLKNTQFDLTDDTVLKLICKKYQVTATAFMARVLLLKKENI